MTTTPPNTAPKGSIRNQGSRNFANNKPMRADTNNIVVRLGVSTQSPTVMESPIMRSKNMSIANVAQPWLGLNLL